MFHSKRFKGDDIQYYVITFLSPSDIGQMSLISKSILNRANESINTLFYDIFGAYPENVSRKLSLKALHKGMSPLLRYQKDCFLWASSMGYIHFLQKLVDQQIVKQFPQGINTVKDKDEEKTAFHLACYNGLVSIASFLVSNGANPSKMTKIHQTSLHLCCEKDRYHTLSYLLKHQYCSLNQIDDQKRTALFIACEQGSHKCVNLLIRSHCDLNISNRENKTPLHIACENGHIQSVKLLVDNGANILALTETGKSPLFVASENGHSEICTLLLKAGSDVRQASFRQKNPLYVAAENGYVDVVKALLPYSVESDCFTLSNYGTTPMFIANRHPNKEVKKLLTQFVIENRNKIKKKKRKIIPPEQTVYNYKRPSTPRFAEEMDKYSQHYNSSSLPLSLPISPSLIAPLSPLSSIPYTDLNESNLSMVDDIDVSAPILDEPPLQPLSILPSSTIPHDNRLPTPRLDILRQEIDHKLKQLSSKIIHSQQSGPKFPVSLYNQPKAKSSIYTSSSSSISSLSGNLYRNNFKEKPKLFFKPLTTKISSSTSTSLNPYISSSNDTLSSLRSKSVTPPLSYHPTTSITTPSNLKSQKSETSRISKTIEESKSISSNLSRSKSVTPPLSYHPPSYSLQSQKTEKSRVSTKITKDPLRNISSLNQSKSISRSLTPPITYKEMSQNERKINNKKNHYIPPPKSKKYIAPPLSYLIKPSSSLSLLSSNTSNTNDISSSFSVNTLSKPLFPYQNHKIQSSISPSISNRDYLKPVQKKSKSIFSSKFSNYNPSSNEKSKSSSSTSSNASKLQMALDYLQQRAEDSLALNPYLNLSKEKKIENDPFLSISSINSKSNNNVAKPNQFAKKNYRSYNNSPSYHSIQNYLDKKTKQNNEYKELFTKSSNDSLSLSGQSSLLNSRHSVLKK